MDVNKIIMESIKDITAVTEATPAVKIPTAGEKDPGYIPTLRKTFNSFPKHGKQLQVVGKGQTPPPSRIDQAILDDRWKQIRGEELAKGKIAPEAAKIASQKVKEEVKKSPKSFMGKVGAGVKKAEHAVVTGAEKVGHAVTTGAKYGIGKIKGNPKTSAAVAAALAAGAGAVVFRKKIAKMYEKGKEKVGREMEKEGRKVEKEAERKEK